MLAAQEHIFPNLISNILVAMMPLIRAENSVFERSRAEEDDE